MDPVRLIILALAATLATSCGPVLSPPAVAPARRAGGYVLHTLPDWAPVGGFALGHHVFLQRSQQNDMGIAHELVHVRQQADQPLWFWATYVVSPSWRLRWEAEAYAVQARAGCPVDGDHGLAAYLSGPAYLWTATRDEAARGIRKFL
jgi:hypothetical protein